MSCRTAVHLLAECYRCRLAAIDQLHEGAPPRLVGGCDWCGDQLCTTHLYVLKNSRRICIDCYDKLKRRKWAIP